MMSLRTIQAQVAAIKASPKRLRGGFGPVVVVLPANGSEGPEPPRRGRVAVHLVDTSTGACRWPGCTERHTPGEVKGTDDRRSVPGESRATVATTPPKSQEE